MIALVVDRDVEAWRTRILAEWKRRKNLLDPEFTAVLRMVREVRLSEVVK